MKKETKQWIKQAPWYWQILLWPTIWYYQDIVLEWFTFPESKKRR